jgi:hypothetical protein
LSQKSNIGATLISMVIQRGSSEASADWRIVMGRSTRQHWVHVQAEAGLRAGTVGVIPPNQPTEVRR